jgi:hypothetical protein
MGSAIEDILRDELDKIDAKIEQIERSLAPLFAEREKIRRALESVAEPHADIVAASAVPDDSQSDGGASNPFSSLTMKELTVKALNERFKNGATAAQLMTFFSDAWGRKDIRRSSYSPQLSRLKSEGVIELDGKIWRLADPTIKKNEPPKGGSETGEAPTSLKLSEDGAQRDIFG